MRERLTGFLVLSILFKLLPSNVARRVAPAHELSFVRPPHLTCTLGSESCAAAHGIRGHSRVRVIRVERSKQLFPQCPQPCFAVLTAFLGAELSQRPRQRMIRGRIRAEMGYIWAILCTGNAGIINETIGDFGGGLGHGAGNVRIAKRKWGGKK